MGVRIHRVVASLPVIVVLNSLPDIIGEAGIAADILVIGAFIAGLVATSRSADPTAAGLRAGFIGGVIGTLIFAVAELT